MKTAYRSESSDHEARWAVMCTWGSEQRHAGQKKLFRDQGSMQKIELSSRIGSRKVFTVVRVCIPIEDAAGSLPKRLI